MWVSPEALCSDIHLLHAQVSGRRGLTWAAGDRRHRQAAEEKVHGGQEGLQKTDGAESRASVGGEVDFIGVRAGRLEERFVLTSRPGGKAVEKSKEVSSIQIVLFTLQLKTFGTFSNDNPRGRPSVVGVEKVTISLVKFIMSYPSLYQPFTSFKCGYSEQLLTPSPLDVFIRQVSFWHTPVLLGI